MARREGFFSGPSVGEPQLADAAEPVAGGPEARSEQPVHISRRERLYAELGGALIGLGGAAALLNFVLLK